MSVEIKKLYKGLNKKRLEEDPQLFMLGVLTAHSSSLIKGENLMVVGQSETTEKGTEFYYKQIKTKEDANNCMSKINDISKALGEDLTIADIVEIALKNQN